MRSYIKYLILLVVLLSIFSIGAVCAGDLENTTINEYYYCGLLLFTAMKNLISFLI